MCFKEAMKDILVLLVLLNVQTIKVYSQPYQADSDGNCHDPKTEYLLDSLNLCCKKCLPGQRLQHMCTETADTVCEPCPADQFIEGINYSPNCFSCTRCKRAKGLQVVQNCSSATRSKCGCQPGMFCIMGFDDPYCEECTKYTPCKAGYGVSVPGTANSDVRCERCPSGTFSDTVSSTDHCRPHTICDGTAVVRKGDATSDTECESKAFIPDTRPQNPTKEPHKEIVVTAAATTMSTVSSTSESKTSRGTTESISSSAFKAVFNPSAKSLPPSPETDSILVVVIVSVFGVLVLFIIIILLILCKTVWKKDVARFHPKVDANGNCEIGDKIYLGETKMTSSKEQQCLLENGEACSEQSQSSGNTTETLTRTDGCNSYESIGPLQSTIALHNPQSAISPPMTLLSNTESVNPQTSIPTQSSFQPTSPQIISPETTSPQVNVNIIFSIGNGSGGTPSVIPTDLIQVDSKLPFGEEEESSNIPQQEDGKQSQMSVQESASYSA